VTRLTKAIVAWSGLRENVSKIIRDGWHPGKLDSEANYRDSLATFLRESAPDAHVEVEYRHQGTTTDIYLKWRGIFSTDELFIELKYNLRHKAEYDRLVGQIEQIGPKKHSTVLVLCGEELNANVLTRLHERYTKTGDFIPLLEIIIVKN
jgi:hypothetical protein